MAQFYCLSVMLSLLCGLILIYGHDDELADEAFEDSAGKKAIPGVSKIQEGIAGESLFTNELFRLVCGALCFVTGLVVFFAPYRGVAVFGDLIPALACLFAGAAVLLGYFEDRSDDFIPPEILDVILTNNRLYIGIAALFAGVLHFVLPGVPLI
ncbi:MAG: hypothetical protein K6A42_01755 [Treponema sp.]|nr:hypothetical protein [Treponema sp.]